MSPNNALHSDGPRKVSAYERPREDRDVPRLIAFGFSIESNRPNCVGD